ncbi:MAG TPA: hypothetical protein VN176_01890 [Verrucomicrobiae bacterium]|jgi:hypothetical protein|nr:hypothetical protein [Verrucomicrobiae bacterium]
MRLFIAFLLVALAAAAAQTTSEPATKSNTQAGAAAQTASQPTDTQGNSDAATSGRKVTIPAGTKVLLYLKSPISTKHARVGDGVYCQTNFPVTQENLVVIPAGTYVKGRITEVKRAGRVKGRAEVLFNFDTMIFPGGYTVELPGSLEDIPGATNQSVSDKEGTVKADSQKGKDAATVAKTAGGGAAIGAVAGQSIKGAGIGGGIGAAVGIAEVLLTRGQDVHIEQGTALEMVLQRPLTVDISEGERSDAGIVPRPTNHHRMRVPNRDRSPQ